MRIVKAPEVRRSEILECAMRLFSKQGYDATSVNHIIAVAGISKGAFYHHFESKEDLIEALAARYAAEAAAAAQPILEDESLDSFSRLAAFLKRLRDQKQESAAELRTTFEPLFRPENLQLYFRTQAAVTEVVRPILAGIIARGVEEKCFDTSDPKAAADIILFLMSASREQISAIYHCSDDLERRRLVTELHDRMQFVSTVVDRILGVPEGSIVFADRDAVEAILAGWHTTDSAA